MNPASSPWSSKPPAVTAKPGRQPANLAGGPLITALAAVPRSSRPYRDERVFGQVAHSSRHWELCPVHRGPIAMSGSSPGAPSFVRPLHKGGKPQPFTRHSQPTPIYFGPVKNPLSVSQSAIRCGHVFTVTSFDRSPMLNACLPLARKIASTGTLAASSFS